MKKTVNYILPPLFYLCVALIGGSFTAKGMDGWYQSLIKPAFTPSGGFIGMVWTAIYVMAALSMMLYLNSGAVGRKRAAVVGLYVFLTVPSTPYGAGYSSTDTCSGLRCLTPALSQ